MPRRLLPLLLHLPSLLSALLLLTLSAFQLRSLWRSDSLVCTRLIPAPPRPATLPHPPPHPRTTVRRFAIQNVTGGLYLSHSRSTLPRPRTPSTTFRRDTHPPQSFSRLLTSLPASPRERTRHLPGLRLTRYDAAPATHATSLAVSIWLLLPATAVLPTISTLLILRRRRTQQRLSLGQCPHCGYDLRATPEKCPECGRLPPPHFKVRCSTLNPHC